MFKNVHILCHDCILSTPLYRYSGCYVKRTTPLPSISILPTASFAQHCLSETGLLTFSMRTSPSRTHLRFVAPCRATNASDGQAPRVLASMSSMPRIAADARQYR